MGKKKDSAALEIKETLNSPRRAAKCDPGSTTVRRTPAGQGFHSWGVGFYFVIVLKTLGTHAW